MKKVKYGLYFVVGLAVYCCSIVYFLLLFRPLTGVESLYCNAVDNITLHIWLLQLTKQYTDCGVSGKKIIDK